MAYAIGNKYPMDTPEMVKMAAGYIGRFIERFPYEDRIVAAVNIEKQAANLGVIIEDGWVKNYSRAMKKEAKLSPEFETSVRKRIELCKQARLSIKVSETAKAPAADVFETLIKDAANMHPTETYRVLKFFDKQAGLHTHYDKAILDPAMSVYGHSSNYEYDAVKVAGDVTNYDMVRVVADKPVMQKIASAFGEGVCGSMSTNWKKTVSSMSDAEKALLSNIVKGK